MKKKIVFFCYGVAAFLFLLMTFGAWLADLAGTASGRCSARELTPTQLTMYDLRQNDDGTLTVIGGDPQLLYPVSDGERIRSIRLRLSAPIHGEGALYYLKNGQTDFSGRQIVLSAFGEEQDFTYRLPRFTRCTVLRLDLGCGIGDTFAIEELYLNAPQPLSAYLSVSPRLVAELLFLPLLAACAVITGIQLLHSPKNSENGG